ncbi:MAG: PLDc N-terminal domain-containing protein [Cyclobacteriaceae bacterium]|nr:PLDc N-terminal domain-containing protein [Cyclobacteriaceae bacterium]MDW8330448.1 PLDc N-terminal domain-containing protein [Cyclobacteriaceae bacterium]
MIRFATVIAALIMVLAVYDVWKREPSMEKRLLWTALIIILPLFGAVAWLGISRGYIKL